MNLKETFIHKIFFSSSHQTKRVNIIEKYSKDEEMNIFWLHLTPREQVKLYCDTHVVKIILEITQMLYTSWHILKQGKLSESLLRQIKNTEKPEGYKPTHRKHPIVEWICKDHRCYIYCSQIGIELCQEYKFRYPDKPDHKCKKHLEALQRNLPFSAQDIIFDRLTLFRIVPPICVGDEKYLVPSCCAKYTTISVDIESMEDVEIENTLTCKCCDDNNPKYKGEAFNVVESYRKYYLECKMNEIHRFTYTNREVPRFILDSFPRIAWEPLWPSLRLILIGNRDEESILSSLPMEIIAIIERYVLTWPYIGKGSIESRIKRETKKKESNKKKDKKDVKRKKKLESNKKNKKKIKRKGKSKEKV